MYNVSPRQLEYCVEIAEKAPVTIAIVKSNQFNSI